MVPARVVNVSRGQACDVYVGRGGRDYVNGVVYSRSRWGNPFREGEDGTREEVIEKYRKWIRKQPELMAALFSLRGKKLGCHCAPKPCHADVLAEMARDVRGSRRFTHNRVAVTRTIDFSDATPRPARSDD